MSWKNWANTADSMQKIWLLEIISYFYKFTKDTVILLTKIKTKLMKTVFTPLVITIYEIIIQNNQENDLNFIPTGFLFRIVNQRENGTHRQSERRSIVTFSLKEILGNVLSLASICKGDKERYCKS